MPRGRDRRIDRSALAIAAPTSTTTSAKMPSRISLPAVLVELLPEKNSDSRMIEPNSAIEAAAMTS